jgi:hypothetical protein
METRPYFIMGDLISNILTGSLVGLLCVVILDPEWTMFSAMLLGMGIGMGFSAVFGALVLFRFFGAMEVMIPTMLTGMLVGMLVGMAASMMTLSAGTAVKIGALTGLVVLILTYIANYKLTDHQ